MTVAEQLRIAANGKRLVFPTEAREAEKVSQSVVLRHSPVSRDQAHSTPSIGAGRNQARRALRPQLSFRPGALSRLDLRWGSGFRPWKPKFAPHAVAMTLLKCARRPVDFDFDQIHARCDPKVRLFFCV